MKAGFISIYSIRLYRYISVGQKKHTILGKTMTNRRIYSVCPSFLSNDTLTAYFCHGKLYTSSFICPARMKEGALLSSLSIFASASPFSSLFSRQANFHFSTLVCVFPPLGIMQLPSPSVISLGEGQEPVAIRAMNGAAVNGTWVLLQNCELGLGLMNEMEVSTIDTWKGLRTGARMPWSR